MELVPPPQASVDLAQPGNDRRLFAYLSAMSAAARAYDAALRGLDADVAELMDGASAPLSLDQIRAALSPGGPYALPQQLGVTYTGQQVVFTLSGTPPRPETVPPYTLNARKNGAIFEWWYRSSTAPPAWVEMPPDIPTDVARTGVANTFTFAQTIQLAAAGAMLNFISPNSSSLVIRCEMEELNVTGVTTKDTAATFLRATSLILAVTGYITQTISGGGVATYSIGDATTAARFTAADANLTAGNGIVGLQHLKGSVATDATGPVQVAAAAARVTLSAAPTQGKIRLVAWQLQFAPASS